MELDLPLIWAGLIATAVFLYVVLDGFDLGVGILFPFAGTHRDRDTMMNSLAPFWDGNETWLVLGGGGLLAAFPLAYAILLPALYLPLIVMLLALVFRGVAFEFRFKAIRSRPFWDWAFAARLDAGGLLAGRRAGHLHPGHPGGGRAFAGGAFDWLSPFALLTGVALVVGYALLGAAWLVMKTEAELQDWAFRLLPALAGGGARGHRRRCRSGRRCSTARSPSAGSRWPNISTCRRYPCWCWRWRPCSCAPSPGASEDTPFFCALGLFLLSYIGLADLALPLHRAACASPSARPRHPI